MSEFIRTYIAMGSNLGNPAGQVRKAYAALATLSETRPAALSSLYLSAPVAAAGPDFINAVAAVDTRLPAPTLLRALLDIEHRHGRDRTYRNAPRTLDLDLLLYDGLICRGSGLTLPHPRMHQRAFVLLPLLEICPDCRIPGLGLARDWLKHCGNQSVRRIEADVAAGQA
jgi:2-amino-4-hydroxy-6-hydroxymethyldihydropteridine diphosphokinase